MTRNGNKHKNGQNDILKGLFIQLMIVNILLGLVQPCNQLIDSVVTGKMLGTDALKTFALILPVMSLVAAVSFVFSIGTQINVSNTIGKGRSEEAQVVVNTSFFSAIVFSLAFAAVLFAFSGPIAVLLGASNVVEGQINDASRYLCAYAIGIPAVFLVNTMLSLLQLEGKKKIVVLLSLCVIFVNVSGDLLNVFVLKQGMFGIALATSAANITVCVILIVYFLHCSRMFRFSVKGFSKEKLFMIIRNGLPSLTYYGSIVVRTAFFNYLILSMLDNDTLAVMLVINSFLIIVDAVMGGIGDSVLLLGGVLHGERDLNGKRILLKTSLLWGIIILFCITLISIGFANNIAAVFSDNSSPEFIEATAHAIRITAICFVPDIISCIIKKYIQSVGRARYTAVTNVLCNIVYICVAAYILVKSIGSDGIFIAYSVCYVLMLLTHLMYAWMVAGRSFRNGPDIFLFEAGGYTSDHEHSWLYQARTMDDCVNVSKQAYDLCRQHHIRRAYLISLFTEEITKNTIEHGFRKDNRPLIIIKLMIFEEKIMLSIKDNCAFFDPMDYYNVLLNKDDCESGFGIRIVMNLADKVAYTNTFSLNNLFIELSR